VDNSALVKETSATDDEIKEVSGYIKSYYKADNIKYLLSSKSALQGVIKPMVYGFSDKNDDVYMNLFLD
jgi:vacuolar-type H+-ATPase subunit C/Vma6